MVFLFGVAYMHRLLLAEALWNGHIAARLVTFDGLETREDGDRLRLRAGHFVDAGSPKSQRLGARGSPNLFSVCYSMGETTFRKRNGARRVLRLPLSYARNACARARELFRSASASTSLLAAPSPSARSVRAPWPRGNHHRLARRRA